MCVRVRACVRACAHAYVHVSMYVPEEFIESDRLAGQQASVTSSLHASSPVLGYRRLEY